MKDNFDKFEEKVYNFFTTMSVTKYILSKILMVWIIFSLAVVSILGIVGGGIVEVKMQENYINGTLTQGGYDMWNNVFTPIMIWNFNTVEILMLVVAIGWGCFIVYPVLKIYYRKKKDN